MISLWRTLIIDDEALARERLKRLLLGSNFFQICGEAENGDEAQMLIEAIKPDIIFLDIQMPGKDVFTMLSDVNHKPFVVFCTAFDHYALKAFEAYSIDYLIKPVDEVRLRLTIEKIQKIAGQYDHPSLQTVIDAIRKMEPKPVPTSIPHKLGDKTILVKLENVAFFEAEDKYVNFYNAEGTRFISDQSLKTLSEKLPENFVRVSKSVIINKLFVNEVHRYFRGKVIFVMDDVKKTKITSGSTYSEIIKNSFDL
jgi:two-component system, LytTR family, response regulator